MISMTHKTLVTICGVFVVAGVLIFLLDVSTGAPRLTVGFVAVCLLGAALGVATVGLVDSFLDKGTNEEADPETPHH